MEHICTCKYHSHRIDCSSIDCFKNANQVLEIFANNQLDNVKTVSSTDDSFFAKYLTSEKVSS